MSAFDEENKKIKKTLVKKARTMAKRDSRILHLNAAILSVYGWQMAIPTLIGVLIGRILDHHIPVAHVSWTLNLIIIGAVIGFFNANHWVKKEGILKGKNKK